MTWHFVHFSHDVGFESARLEGFQIKGRRETSPEEIAVQVRRLVRIGHMWNCTAELRQGTDKPS